MKDDDVEVSQHFFALRLTKEDVLSVLQALQNASVVTDSDNGQVVNNGGPSDIQSIVKTLGKKSLGGSATKATLSSGVVLISKPSVLHVPPWQMVSALLGGEPLRVATWWTKPEIPSTTASSSVGCWDNSLATPGAVENATTGTWESQQFGLTGGPGRNFNHAKVGVSTSSGHHYAIFGDMNQQGSLSGPNCASSQNGRGGLFYVVDDAQLSDGLKGLLTGSSAPSGP